MFCGNNALVNCGLPEPEIAGLDSTTIAGLNQGAKHRSINWNNWLQALKLFVIPDFPNPWKAIIDSSEIGLLLLLLYPPDMGITSMTNSNTVSLRHPDSKHKVISHPLCFFPIRDNLSIPANQLENGEKLHS